MAWLDRDPSGHFHVCFRLGDRKFKRAKSKPAADAKPKKLSALNAAAKILTDAKEPMACKELIEAMKKGLWTSPQGQDTFGYSLQRDSQRDQRRR